MDLANFDLKANAEKGCEVKILHPIDGTPTDIIVSVVGSDSSRYRNANIASMVEFPFPEGATVEQKASTLSKRAAVCLAACVTGWEGLELDGEPYPYGEGKALTLLNRFDWLADQLAEKIKVRENFG